MRKATRHEFEARMKPQVRPWLEERNLPLVLFDKLKYENKVLLHNIVAVGKRDSTDAQLRDLYTDLGLLESRGEAYYPTNEELRETFYSHGISYQEKF